MATNNFLQSPYDDLVDDLNKQALPGQQATKPQEMPDVTRARGPAPEPVTFAPAQKTTAKPADTGDAMPPAELRPVFEASAKAFDVPVNVLMALGHQESRYNPLAIGQKTEYGRAKGIMQYLDSTAKGLGINPFDPNEAIPAAAKQIRERLDAGASMMDAIKEHFAGPDRKQWGAKTDAYGREVMDKVGLIGQQYAAQPAAPDAPEVPTDAHANAMSTAQPRAEYEQTFKANNPQAGQDAVDLAMAGYDKDAQARAAAAVKRPEDRFAVMNSPDAAFNAKLNAKLQGKANGIVPPLPGRMTQADHVETQPSNGIMDDVADAGRNLKVGANMAAQDLRELLGRVPVIGQSIVRAGDAVDEYISGKPSDKLLADDTKLMVDKMTPDMKAAQAKKWWDSDKGKFGDAWADPRSYESGAIQSLPEQVLTMVPAMALAKYAYGAKIAAGAAEAVASKAAANTAMLAGSLSEGALGGAQSARDVRQQVLDLPQNVLDQSEAYHSLVAGGMSQKEARTALSENLSTRAFVTSGIVTGMFGGMGDRAIAKLFTEQVGKASIKQALGAFGKGAMAEGLLEELPQSAGQQLAQNEAMQHANPNQKLSDDVLNQALGGAVQGGLMGGGMGAVAHGRGHVEAPAARPGPVVVLDTPAAPPSAAGPLSGAVQAADEAPARVVIDSPAGQGSGIVRAYQEDGQGGFRAQVRGDDGQVYTVSDKDGINLSPEHPEAGPLEGALERGAEDHAANPTAAPEPAPVPAEPPKPLTVKEMTLPQLRERMQFIAQQAKINGATKMTVDARKEVEKAINLLVAEEKKGGKDANSAGNGTGGNEPSRSGAVPVLPEDDHQAAGEPAGNAGDAGAGHLSDGTAGAAVPGDTAAHAAAIAQPALTEIDAAAHEAATSPHNDLAEPTDAQKEAGNYKLGRISLHGLDIAVENPRDSVRSGKRPDGSTWSHTMSDHYGYLNRTVGADGDHVDVYVGPKPESKRVYVVDQIDQQSGKFDEHKAMLGYTSRQQAVAAYRANFDKGWKVGPVKGMDIEQFKGWLKDGDTTRPAAEHQNEPQIIPKNIPEQSAAIVDVKDNYGRTHRVRQSDIESDADRLPTVRKNGDIVSGEEIPRSIINRTEQQAAPGVPDATAGDSQSAPVAGDGIAYAVSLADQQGLKGPQRKAHAVEHLAAKWGMAKDEVARDPEVIAALRKSPKKADKTAAAERFVEGVKARALDEVQQSRAPVAKRIKYPLPMGDSEGAKTVHEGQKAVVDHMNGDINKSALIKRLAALNLYQGHILSITNRLEDFNNGDVRKVVEAQQQRGFNLDDEAGAKAAPAADVIPIKGRGKAAITGKAKSNSRQKSKFSVHGRDLVITHNLTAENLLHANRMGGIAVPSLAVTKKDSSLSGFGDITMIGSRALADPKGYAGTKVFGADIYSPRYPSIDHNIDKAALTKLNAELAPFRSEGEREIYRGDIDRIDDLVSNKAFKAYAGDKLGVDPKNLDWQQLKYEAGQLLHQAGAEERIFQGYTNSGNRRYVPHTLENVVKILKKEMRGGENFNYGAGSVRAKYTPQFKSIAQIQKEKGRLVDKGTFGKLKDEINDEIFAIADSLKPYHRASGGFGFGDTVAMMMSDAATMGIHRALTANGFDDVPASSIAEVNDFIEKLRHLPTEYFEAKILRDVDLSEFSGAVIPASTPQSVRDVLAKRGIPFKEYGTEAERAAAVDAFAQELDASKGDILFSNGQRAGAPLDAASLRTAVTQGALGPVVNSMIDAGLVVLHDDTSTLPRNVGHQVAGIQAVTTPDGKVHLVASALTAQNARAVMLHEAFHQGGEKLVGTAKWDELMRRAGALYRQSEQSTGKAHEFYDKARQRVFKASIKGAVEPHMEVEEFAAYAIEEYESAPKAVRSWVDDMVGAVKAWLFKRFGKQLGQVTPAQLSSMAKMAVLDTLVARRGEAFGHAGDLFSVDAASKPSKVFGAVAGMAKQAYASLGFRAKDAVDTWNVNWSTGALEKAFQQGGPIADEIRAAFAPVRERLHAIYGDTMPLYRGEGASDGTSAPGRKLFSWSPIDSLAERFAENRHGPRPKSITDEEIARVVDQYDRTGFATFRNKKFKRNNESPEYFDIYDKHNEMITDGDDLAELLRGDQKHIAERLDELKAKGSVYKAEVPIDDIVWIPVGANLAHPEFIAMYDPRTQPSAKYSVADDAAPEGYTPPEQGLLRRFQSTVQDNLNRVKEVQQRIREISGAHDLGKSDYYGAETNRPGRIAARLEDAQRLLTGPMMERLGKSLYTPAQLSELLHAQHAQERNERVADINPEMPDGGSGMTTADANSILAKYKDDKELHDIAKQARAIARATLDLKLSYGLIDEDTHATLATAYENYVPLKGDGEYGPKIKRAMGHDGRDEHILENIARDYDQAVVSGEKNLARQSLLRMALQYPDPALWTVGVPPKGRYVAGKVYNIVHFGQTVASFTSQSQVTAYLEAKGSASSQYQVLDSNGEQVAEFTKPLQDNEVMVYVKGSPVRIQVFDEKLASQLRPLDSAKMGVILEKMRGMNRYLSKIYTGYNPAFILRNTSRDAMTGTINMLGNEGAAIAARAWMHYPAALGALAQWAATSKAPEGKTGVYLREYRDHGGKTGASWMSDLETQGKTLQRMYEDAYGVMGHLDDGMVGKAAVIAGRKIVGGMAHVVEIANTATENALRLALYIAMREKGESAGKAAQAAKGVTVDFDRKGTQTGALGAIYLFFNPAVQGTANALRTLAKGKHKGQAWSALGALAALGAWAASKGMDDDKDRWLGEGWDTRTKSFMLTVGSHQIRVPMSQEFNPFYAFGVAMAEAGRGESKMKSSARMVSSFLDAYFPPHGFYREDSDNQALDAAMSLVPTVLQPMSQVAVNRNSFGSQVVPETNLTKDRADNLKMFRSTKNTAYDGAAQFIAGAGEAMGAGKYENDISKVSPETLKLMWRTYTGGLGQFITDTAGLAAMGAIDPGQVEVGDVPIVKDFVKSNDVKAIRGRWYDLAKDAHAASVEFEQIRKAGDSAAMDKFLADPERGKIAAMGKLVSSINKAAASIKDAEVDINADKTMPLAKKRAALKDLEKQEQSLYRDGIAAFK